MDKGLLRGCPGTGSFMDMKENYTKVSNLPHLVVIKKKRGD